VFLNLQICFLFKILYFEIIIGKTNLVKKNNSYLRLSTYYFIFMYLFLINFFLIELFEFI